MKEEYYGDWVIEKSDEFFSFFSIGTKGKILKCVEITRTGELLYDLSFGDVIHSGSIDDKAISNNGDFIKVLATVYQILKHYLEKYPSRKIAFAGSTESRTRLYRIIIGNNLDELNKKYSIFGINDDFNIEVFRKNIKYYSFLLSKK